MTIFRERKEAWQKYASKCNRFTPLREIWDQVRVLTSRRASGAFPQLRVQNIFVTDPLAVANVFADHFASISSTNIYPAGVHQSLTDETETLMFGSDNSESYNAPFTLRELKLSLTQTGNKTSFGPDGLPYSFFTNLNELNLSTLLIAFNNLWTGHSFPAEWLESIVTPILKPGKDRHELTSYRPISLTNCICKILERMVNTRLRYYLESKCCIDPCQSGFRKGRSTADNVIRLLSDVQTSWEFRKPTVAVFLDLISAFNKVHRSAVIYKLHQIGIRGHMAFFLCNFLQPRSFRVRCQMFARWITGFRKEAFCRPPSF